MMKNRFRRQSIGGALASAAILYGASHATEMAKAGSDDDPNPDFNPRTKINPDSQRASDYGYVSPTAAPAGNAAVKDVSGYGASVDISTGISAPDLTPSAQRDEVLITENDPLRIYPAAINARAVRGEESVSFQGFLWQAWPNPSPIKATAEYRRATKLTLRSLDLTDAQDDKAIHADQVTLGVRADQAPKNHAVGNKAPTRIFVSSLGIPSPWYGTLHTKDAPSGEYHGFLLAVRETAGQRDFRPPIPVPVTLEIRDSPRWVLAILFIGTLMSCFLRIYPGKRQSLDKLYVRVDDLNRRILSDGELARPTGMGAPFRQRFATQLRQVIFSLDSQTNPKPQTATAEQALSDAEKLWEKWGLEREEWIKALRLQLQSLKALQRLGSDSMPVHPGALFTELKEAQASAPDSLDAATLEKSSISLSGAVDRYFRITNQLARAKAYFANPAVQGADENIKKIEDLLSSWNALDPIADESGVQAQALTIPAALAELQKSAGLPKSSSEMSLLSGGPKVENQSQALIPNFARGRVRTARALKTTYAILTSVTVFLGLVMLGYQKTYADHWHFGANPLTDYLGVVAWVLGSDLASRATLLALTEGTPNPGDNATGDGAPGSGSAAGNSADSVDGGNDNGLANGNVANSGGAGSNSNGDIDDTDVGNDDVGNDDVGNGGAPAHELSARPRTISEANFWQPKR